MITASHSLHWVCGRNERASHLQRVESGEVAPLKSLVYTDMVSGYRKIKDHGLNIVETYAD